MNRPTLKQQLQFGATSRRNLLKGLAATTAMAGLGVHAKAAEAPAKPKRVVFVFIPGGAPTGLFTPEGCGNQFTLLPASAPLEPVKQHCVFFPGLTHTQAGHGTAHFCLGGDYRQDRGTTVDVLLADAMGADSAIPHLPIGVQSKNYSRLSMRDGELLPFVDDPYVVLDAITGGATRWDSPLLSGFNGERYEFSTEFDLAVDRGFELATFALQAGATRNITLMLGHDQCEFYMPEGSDWPYDYHQAIAAGSTQDYVEFRAYLSAKMRYLIQLLAVTRDSDGDPLLDSTLVVHVTDMADGRDHAPGRSPFFLAGGSNYIHNGTLAELDFNFSHLDFLDTVTTALGHPEISVGTQIAAGVIA